MGICQISFSNYKQLFPYLILPGFFNRLPGFSMKLPSYIHTISYKEVEMLAPDATKEAVKAFLEALYGDFNKVDQKVLHNLFNVKYVRGTLDSFGSPVICKHNGNFGLLFGTEVSNSDKKFNFLPLTIKNGSLMVNKSTITLMRKEALDLSASNPQTAPKIIYPVYTLRQGDFVFDLNVKTKMGTDYYSFEECVNRAIEAKNIDLLVDVVTPLFGYTSQIGSMFSNQFESNCFPNNGVAIPVTGYKFIDSQYPSLLLTVDCSKMPAISVVCTAKDENGKQIKFDAPLNEVSKIFVSSNHAAYSSIKQYIEAGLEPKSTSPFYLYVYEMGRSYNEVPRHVVYESSYISDEVKQALIDQSQPTYFLPSSSQLNLIPDYSTNPL